MRAKSINSKLNELNFQRGENPKETLGIGIKNLGDYVRHYLKEKNVDVDPDEFWSSFGETIHDSWGMADLIGSYVELLLASDAKHKNIIQSDLDYFIESYFEESEGEEE